MGWKLIGMDGGYEDGMGQVDIGLDVVRQGA